MFFFLHEWLDLLLIPCCFLKAWLLENRFPLYWLVIHVSSTLPMWIGIFVPAAVFIAATLEVGKLDRTVSFWRHLKLLLVSLEYFLIGRFYGTILPFHSGSMFWEWIRLQFQRVPVCHVFPGHEDRIGGQVGSEPLLFQHLIDNLGNIDNPGWFNPKFGLGKDGEIFCFAITFHQSSKHLSHLRNFIDSICWMADLWWSCNLQSWISRHQNSPWGASCLVIFSLMEWLWARDLSP